MLIAPTASLALLAAAASSTAASSTTSIAPSPLAHSATTQPLGDPGPERYRAWLDTPGGDLPFFIELTATEAFLVNGPERIPVPYPDRSGGAFRLEMPYFDSVLEAAPSESDPQRLDGTWRKVRGADNTAEVPFHMDARLPWRFEPVNGLSRTAEAVAGRWQVDFESGDVPAVGLFEAGDSLEVTGTFLTNTGDYRYLAGEFRQEELLLSCFDGAHAFLFRADLSEAGTLSGKFWSGDWWEEGWTAERNEQAALPNAFEEVEALYEAPVASLSFPDSKGVLRHVMDYTPNGEVLLVQIFGSWCPNCHDETAYLRELDERYRDRGLRIVGLAFELTGDVKRDGAQLDKFRERHGIEYPLLLAGKANKAATALALGLTDHVLSYPTTLFVDRNGQIRSIHSGFSGPAAATEHAQLRSEFEAQIEALLDEPTARQVEQGAEVSLEMDHPLEFSVHGSWESYPFFRASNRKKAQKTSLYIESLDRELSGRISDSETTLESHLPVRVFGQGVQVGSHRFYTAGDGDLVSLGDLGRRFGKYMVTGSPMPRLVYQSSAVDGIPWKEGGINASNPVRAFLCYELGIFEEITPEERSVLVEALSDRSVHVQAHAAWALGQHPHPDSRSSLTAALDSPNPVVRREAARALGALPKDAATTARLTEIAKNDPHRLVRDAAVSAWNALRVQNH
jgi:thiol-disulfide isomerase/thioredoxin